MTEDFEKCSIKRRYDLGTRICPYCREHELKISAIVEYDSESNKTEVRIHGDDWHIKSCRDEREMKLNNFVSWISNLKLCGNCDSFTKRYCGYDDEEAPKCDKYPNANQDFHELGTCGAWELKKKWYDDDEHQNLEPSMMIWNGRGEGVVDIL